MPSPTTSDWEVTPSTRQTSSTGHTFGSVEEGFAYVNNLAEGEVGGRVDAALDGLASAVVYAGVSFGVMQAQRLAQTRPETRGALLYESCLPISGEWAVGPWPDGLPVQVHGAQGDEFFAEDLPAARELVEAAGPRGSSSPTPGTATSSPTAASRRTTRRPPPW